MIQLRVYLSGVNTNCLLMNRTLHLLLILFPITVSWGQQTLSVSATVSPAVTHTVYANRYWYPESDGQVVEPVYLSGSRWASGFSVGASVLYTFEPGWSFSSGIWFQQLSTRQPRQAAAGSGTSTLNDRAIRLPLLFTYESSTRRLSPYFSFGVFVDVPITARVVVRRDGESTQHLRLKRGSKPIFQGMLGAGIQYKLTNRYRLMAQPVWTYNFGQFGGAFTHDPSFELSLLTQVAYSF